MAKVVRPAGKWRSELGLGEGLLAGPLKYAPQRGRQVDAAAVGLEEAAVPRCAVLPEVLAQHRHQDRRDRHSPDRVARAALALARLTVRNGDLCSQCREVLRAITKPVAGLG